MGFSSWIVFDSAFDAYRHKAVRDRAAKEFALVRVVLKVRHIDFARPGICVV